MPYVPVNGYAVEIWRSPDTPDNFTLVDTLYQATATNFSLTDAPLTRGRTYYYQARRQDLDTFDYSGWSNIVAIYAPGDTLMAKVPVGSATKLGIGLQPADGNSLFNNFGGVCKMTDLLDYVRGSVDVNRPPIYSDALRDSPSDRTSAPVTGDFEGQGSYMVNQTSEGAFMRVLVALFGLPTTTGAGPYVHTFKNAWDYRLVSLAQLIRKDRQTSANDLIYLYPDSVIDSLQVQVARPQNAVVQAEFGVMVGNRFRIADETTINFDTAAYAGVPPISAARPSVAIGGVDKADFNNFSLDYKMNVEPKLCWRGGEIGPSDWIRVGSSLGISLSTYFSTDEYDDYFEGQTAAVAKPSGFLEAIIEKSFEFSLPVKVGAATHYIKYKASKCAVTRSSTPIRGRDKIEQALQLTPRLDPATGTDLIVEVTNSMNAAAMAAYATALTGMPTNIVY